MLEELREIDTTAIEKLVEIKKEQDRLLSFRRKADDMKGSVDETVYRRVLADYESRQSELDKEGEPLQDEARSAYEKLCAIYDRIKGALEQAQATKAELEFRHAVGEFDQKQLAEKLVEPEGVLEKCKSQLAEADRLKAQFQAVLHSVKEIEDTPREGRGADSRERSDAQPKPEVESRRVPETPPDVSPRPVSEVEPKAKSEAQPKVVPEIRPEAEPEAEPGLQAKVISKRKSEAKPDADSPVEPTAQPGLQAKVISKRKSESVSKVEPKAKPEVQSPLGSTPESELWPEPEPQARTPATKIHDSGPSTDKTFIRPSSDAIEAAVPQAKLAILNEERPTDEFHLGVMNSIGRAVDNTIRIKSPAVSRKHALVTAEAANFTLKDLGSLSGTYVNEKKITECTLADGDRIKIGDVELVFRLL